ncbi:MAG TPA: HD domain-containing protein [Longimicrobiaceae bacterium]|nr:HD domain-containing protein [Longimicrobiaceae bacterium]
MYSSLPNLPELRLLNPPSIRIAPNTRVPFPSEIAELVNHPSFQRLRGVRQLGFVDRIFPSANHSRFEHSLGVFAKAVNYVHALWHDPNCDFFRDTMREREIRTLLVAALCHDLGQYPYSHVIEDTERDEQGDLTDVYDHEGFTKLLLTREDFRQEVLADCAPGAPSLDSIFEKLGISGSDVTAVLDGRDFSNLAHGAAPLLHSIIDGPIDADKLDYLQRDSHHAGVVFGRSIDEDRLFQSLTVVEVDQQGRAVRSRVGNAKEARTHYELAITDKGRVPAEQVMVARWHMFTQLYWHRTTRAHEAVLATAIRRLRGLGRETGFDQWFRKVVLNPRTSDEWFLEVVRAVAAGDGAAGIRFPQSAESRRVIEKCLEMLASLSWSAGRTPYKRLVTVSVSNDQYLYKILQNVRSAIDSSGRAVIDSLAFDLVDRLNATFTGLNLDPLELVVDIPAKRSPANSVWMVSLESLSRGDVSRLSDHSEMWKSFGSDFQSRTRKIRLFCPHHVRERLHGSPDPNSNTARANSLKVYDLLREAAHKIGRVVIQVDAFGHQPG